MRFCTYIYHQFQSSFSPCDFCLKSSIFLLARVLRIVVCPGNSRAKQQPSTKENHYDPITTHHQRHHNHLQHHRIHQQRKITLNQGGPPCPSYPNTPTQQSATNRLPANPQPSLLPPKHKSPMRVASGIFWIFKWNGIILSLISESMLQKIGNYATLVKNAKFFALIFFA